MIFLLQEEIDDYEKFSAWFNGEAVQVKLLEVAFWSRELKWKNKNMLHLVMETPDEETVAGFMSDEQFTADRVAAGVHVETTEVTFLKD